MCEYINVLCTYINGKVVELNTLRSSDLAIVRVLGLFCFQPLIIIILIIFILRPAVSDVA
jgi:hypothetical protein